MGYAKELYTADAIKRMAAAWMEDNADELAGMELDGEPYYDQGIGCWVMLRVSTTWWRMAAAPWCRSTSASDNKEGKHGGDPQDVRPPGQGDGAAD